VTMAITGRSDVLLCQYGGSSHSLDRCNANVILSAFRAKFINVNILSTVSPCDVRVSPQWDILHNIETTARIFGLGPKNVHTLQVTDIMGLNYENV